MLQHRISRAVVAIVATLSLAIFIGTYIAYADTTNFNANAARGLQVSPAIINLNVERGKTYTLTVNALNVTNSEQTYTTSINDFKAKDETGTPELVKSGVLPANASVTQWFSPIDGFSLNGEQTRQLLITLTVPENAEPGGHYGAILFAGEPTRLGTDQQVGVSVKTGLLIFIRVAGDIKENLTLASFTVNKNGKTSSLFENGPLDFVTRFQNEGNVHVQPVGTIEVTDMFNHKVADLTVNNERSNVLPTSIRRFDSVLHTDWMFGYYTANLLVGYGTKGQVLTGQLSFWVIPYKLLLVLLVALLTIGYIGRKLLQAYNQHIINQSKNGKKKTKTNSKKRRR